MQPCSRGLSESHYQNSIFIKTTCNLIKNRLSSSTKRYHTMPGDFILNCCSFFRQLCVQHNGNQVLQVSSLFFYVCIFSRIFWREKISLEKHFGFVFWKWSVGVYCEVLECWGVWVCKFISTLWNSVCSVSEVSRTNIWKKIEQNITNFFKFLLLSQIYLNSSCSVYFCQITIIKFENCLCSVYFK